MQVIERILHMLRVKDCRHVCLFCEYYDMCKQEMSGMPPWIALVELSEYICLH